mmetsp:Transcript_17718/g.54206  ORF Transcript_17718/g.54206 Transcript_17718/m.54206 type:complete len:650 (-) Transcript_17718:207-2156(-)
MELGEGAAAALGLERSAGSVDGAKALGLWKVLNHTVSAGGAKTLRGWLRAPLLDADALRRRQTLVSFLAREAMARDMLRSGGAAASLRRCPDGAALAAKLAAFQRNRDAGGGGGNSGFGAASPAERRRRDACTLKDVVALYRFSLRVRYARDVIADAIETAADEDEAGAMHRAFVKPLGSAVSRLVRFQALVEEVVDPESMRSARRWTRFKVRPSFHPELQRLQGCLDDAMAAMERAADAVRAAAKSGKDKQGNERIKLERTPVRTWHLRVTKRDQRLLSKVKGSRTLAVQSSGVLFTTGAVERAARKVESVEATYADVQRQVEVQALQVAATYAEVFERAAQVLGDLDALASLAHVAALNDWVKPELVPLEDAPGGAFLLELDALRHPCVAAAIGDEFIPNGLRMSGAGDRRVCIMTGPNCGGKSTFIRSVGIAVLLAQAGSFVPAERMRCTLFSRILARVGSSDNQTRGQSTFYRECREVADMLAAADATSLLIIDELGRGTDTFDGFGIAWGVCKHVGQRLRSACLFATHFHEVTELARAPPAAEKEPSIGAFNLHVAADTSGDDIVMLHEVREGHCDRSFGCHVARMARFPPQVVAEAEELTEQFEKASGFRVYERGGSNKRAKAAEAAAKADDDAMAKRRKVAA